MNECKGTVLAMRAIRAHQPGARLVQTEDYADVTCAPGLEAERDFQNQRRWLTFDLLCGRVTAAHPLYAWLARHGVRDDVDWLAANPCPPDVLGVNHYVTSDRYLDPDKSRYPPEHQGTSASTHADVHTTWLRPARGHLPMLMDVWQRYRLPVAITEVHLDAGREDQLRWLREAWTAAQLARRRGADVRAITLWALFGSFDWNRLVTEERGYYEPGAFDVRSPLPRLTAVGSMASAFARGARFTHPATKGAGWWRRRADASSPASPLRRRRPLLVTGGRGTLGTAFARRCEARGLDAVLVAREDLDITSPAAVARLLDDVRPWAIVNAAGFVDVDAAERAPELCYRANTEGPVVLAERCAERGLRLVTFSSDLVFDGARAAPYRERHLPAPLNVYGRSKALAEERVRAVLADALVVRTSALFGPWDEKNFVTRLLRQLVRRERVAVNADHVVSPTYVPALVNTCLDLLIDDASGIVHLANADEVTWLELARRVARAAGLDAALVAPSSAVELGWHAPRPRYSALGSDHALMPALDASLTTYLREGEPMWGRE